MTAVRQVLRRLGKSGIAFVLVSALYIALYFSGRLVQAFLTLFVLLPLGAVLLFRGLRFVQRHSLWSVRNRLLFVYGLIGVLPILLVILGYLGRLPRRTIILTWLALGTYLIQAEVFAVIRADVPLFAAFHPVLALVLFALALIIALQARTVVRAGVQTSSTSQNQPSMEKKGSLAPD